MKQRNETVDIAKGLGIVLVILGHLVVGDGLVSKWIFSFHMPLFYFLSGYVMNEFISSEKYVSRVKSLFFHYISFSAIGLIASFIIPAWRDNLSFKTIAYDIIYNTQPECAHVGQAWFLISLIWVISIFCLTHRIFNFKLLTCIILGGGGYILSAIISKIDVGIYIYNDKLNIPFKLLTSFAAYFFFEIGNAMKQKRFIEIIDGMSFISKILLTAAFALLNVLSSSINGKVNIALCVYNNIFIYILEGMSGIMFIVFLSSLLKNTVIKNCLSFYGKNSMPIFLTHSLLLYSYGYLLEMILKTDISIMSNVSYFASIIGTIYAMILSIPVPYIYNYAVLKIHSLLNCKNVKPKKKDTL